MDVITTLVQHRHVQITIDQLLQISLYHFKSAEMASGQIWRPRDRNGHSQPMVQVETLRDSYLVDFLWSKALKKCV